MVTLCEVGGHKEGLGKSTVRAQDLVSQVLFVFGTKTTHCVPGLAPLSETAI